VSAPASQPTKDDEAKAVCEQRHRAPPQRQFVVGAVPRGMAVLAYSRAPTVMSVGVSIERRMAVLAVAAVLRQEAAPHRLGTAVRSSQPGAVDEYLAGRKAQHPAR